MGLLPVPIGNSPALQLSPLAARGFLEGTNMLKAPIALITIAACGDAHAAAPIIDYNAPYAPKYSITPKAKPTCDIPVISDRTGEVLYYIRPCAGVQEDGPQSTPQEPQKPEPKKPEPKPQPPACP